jgi:nuclear transport factor 2 (NTF2) superfamily protein
VTEAATAAVRGFIEAFNARDLDAFVSVLSPEVELQTRRGIVIGRDEARAWATRKPSGHLHQRLVLDGVRTDGHPPVALIRRQWLWRNSDHVADEEELGVLVSIDDEGLISRWQPFDERPEALRAAGIEPE